MRNMEKDFSQQFKVTKEGNFDFTNFPATKNRGQLTLNISWSENVLTPTTLKAGRKMDCAQDESIEAHLVK